MQTSPRGAIAHNVLLPRNFQIQIQIQITTDRGAQFESKLWDGLCNQFGIVRNRTTSYHPEANGMVERYHRQLKAAIMAHESPNPWTITVPSVWRSFRR